MAPQSHSGWVAKRSGTHSVRSRAQRPSYAIVRATGRSLLAKPALRIAQLPRRQSSGAPVVPPSPDSMVVAASAHHDVPQVSAVSVQPSISLVAPAVVVAVHAPVGPTPVSANMVAPVNVPIAVERPIVLDNSTPSSPDSASDQSLAADELANHRVQRFHAVVVGPSISLTLRVGNTRGCTVDCPSAGQNDWPAELKANVVDGVLYVQGSGQIAVVACTPRLDRLEVSGDSVVTCRGVSGGSFYVAASGHSTVDFDGRAGICQVSLSGGSTLRGSNLTAKQLQALVSGGSAMELGGDFRRVVLNASSGSSLRASGHVNRLNLTATTGSAVDCSGLLARVVQADASGGVVMKVFANKSLDASARLASRIQYSGNPRKLSAKPDVSSTIFL